MTKTRRSALTQRDECTKAITKCLQQVQHVSIDEFPEGMIDSFARRGAQLEKQLAEVNDAVLASANVEDMVEELETQREIDSLRLQLRDLMTKLDKRREIAAQPAEPTGPMVKLPQLDIPKFDGDFLQWNKFSKLFDELIHRNKGLSATGKFHYLKAYLSGDAKRVVDGLDHTEANYAIALEALRKRFNQREKIERLHIERMEKVQTAKSCTDTKGLRNIWEVFNLNVSALEAMGVAKMLYCRPVYAALVRAVPADVSRQAVIRLNRASMDKRENTLAVDGLAADDTCAVEDTIERLHALLNDLHEIIVANEATIGASDDTKLREADQRVEKRYGTQRSTVAFATSATSISSCVLCNGQHDTWDCKTSLSLDQKAAALRDKRACFRCLRTGHRAFVCRTKLSCGICKRAHHTLMHGRQVNREQPTGDGAAVVSNLVVGNKENTVCMETVAVRVKVGDRDVVVRALLDTGSASSFVNESFADSVGLQKMRDETRLLYTLGSSVPKRVNAATYRVKLLPIRADDGGITVDVLGIDGINDATRMLPCLPRKTAKLAQGLTLADKVGDHCTIPVELVLGADVLSDIYTDEPMIRLARGLMARNTIFGHVVMGSVKSSSSATALVSNLCLTASESKRAAEVLWSLEAIGVAASDLKAEGGLEVMKRFADSIELQDGRYAVEIPVKDDVTELADNRIVAANRLKHQLATLARSEERRLLYNGVIQKYLDGNFAEKVPKNEIQNNVMVYYMPHHPVFKPESKSTPVRVVFDCSAHGKGQKALNDVVEQGPNLNNSLVGILLRVREGRYVVTADITKAFLQIVIKPQHRDLFRYLWVDGGEVVHYRFRTLPFGCNCSPFILLATIRHHLAAQSPTPIVNAMLNNFYMDDLVVSCNTEEEAAEIKITATALLKEAGMVLTKWDSNVPGVWDESTPTGAVSKMLGLVWDRELDVFSFHLGQGKLDPGAVYTKRAMLSFVAKLYDPLGFLGPVVCVAKVLFQQACKETQEWNHPISDNIRKRFFAWAEQLDQLKGVSITRHLQLFLHTRSVELHVFCDYSPRAYAAVAYLRTSGDCGVHVSFLMGRHRLSPLEVELKVPKGELVAALIGVRLADFVLQTLTVQVSRCVAWTDAAVVLAWLRGNPQRYAKFVANRLAEIHRTSTKLNVEWRFCPGALNPADRSTRGISVQKFIEEPLWQNGPAFLQQDEECWPAPETQSAEPPDEDMFPVISAATVSEPVPLLLSLRNYSWEWRPLKVAAYVLKFVRGCRPQSTVDLTPRQFLYRELQAELFGEEREAVQQGRAISRTSQLKPYRMCLDQHGLLRIITRLDDVTMSSDERRPVVLADHPFVRAMVKVRHVRLLHAGVSHLMSELRNEVFLIGVRKISRLVVRQCTTCIRYRAQKTSVVTAPLPSVRGKCSRAFENVGVDFTGPLYTRIGERIEKSYIALFTCLVTRGVHLELVTRITAECFLDALRRFAAQRQVPRVIYSDNALAFKKAKGDIGRLYKFIDETKIGVYSRDQGIEWRFSTPYAPWTGGAWERQMRTVKGPLRKVLGSQQLSFEQMATVLKEVEAMVNTRPLFAPTSDVEENPVLTPAHFIYGGPNLLLPTRGPKASEMSAWSRLREQIFTSLWRRFRKEYMLYLRNVHENSGDAGGFEVGEVVLLDEGPVPRGKWRMARIAELHPGRDGVARSATLHTADRAQYRRSTRSLIRLEVRGTSSAAENVAAN